MNTSVFRTASKPVAVKADKFGTSVSTDKTKTQETSVEPPYTDYENINNHPYTVEYFDLGDLWDRPEAGFSKEVGLIENFFKEEIGQGEIGNNKEAVIKKLKQMEKINNIDKTDRKITRIETISAYVEFLMRTSNIKKNISRYGNT